MTTVSVIVPVYNGAATLAACIGSLLDQDQTDVEIIVIDDGSTDCSSEIVSGFSDPRLRLFYQPNAGLAATLSRGIDLACGRYVARLDADDIALPGRLRKQVSFLDAHPEITLLGTWAQIYEGDRPSQRFHRHAPSSDALRLELLLDNPFVHSSVMLRADVLRQSGGYRTGRGKGFPEDFELWSRLAEHHGVANLPEVLTLYRELPGSITRAVGSALADQVVAQSGDNLYRTLAGRYDKDACRAFAALYHGRRPSRSLLPDRQATELWQHAVSRVGGNVSGWSVDFATSRHRMDQRLKTQMRLRLLPAPLIGLLKSIKPR
ncbi:MAG: glycosyltransferase [Candidatus Devosia phytovorans]|uniref:Glycosyltransferase n=1 Tax=Candidatus Devosia phytovorans TaxID=3121372 RepID=A0AAJ6B038_9HYPH|nr:glycosyltransferase [Devosia sp.]WEK03789.1 MAG: glycosyltransferase [Devosia sp.]